MGPIALYAEVSTISQPSVHCYSCSNLRHQHLLGQLRARPIWPTVEPDDPAPLVCWLTALSVRHGTGVHAFIQGHAHSDTSVLPVVYDIERRTAQTRLKSPVLNEAHNNRRRQHRQGPADNGLSVV